MIQIRIPERHLTKSGEVNAYVKILSEWQDWVKAYGLTYKPSGSEISSLDPGTWCVKSYSRAEGRMWDHRRVCFHEDDLPIAIMFKLVWT